MTAPKPVDAPPNRRGVLSNLTIALGAIGVVGVGWALVRSSDDGPGLRPASTDVRFNLSTLARGHKVLVRWSGRPILITYRSSADVAAVEQNRPAQPHPRLADDLRLPAYKRNSGRSLRTDLFVAVASCTYDGVPVDKLDLDQAFGCPRCGSRYDLAGRVYMGPAPRNLAIPPYHFDGPDTLVIGRGPLGETGAEA